EAPSRRRAVLVGGLDGDQASARLVLDAVKWFKTAAPAAVRQAWLVSALPLADPDSRPTPMEFPPAKGYFDDAERPEARYVWRWVAYQAPDAVFVLAPHGGAAATSLCAALADATADPGSAPCRHVDSLDAFRAALSA